MPDEIILKGMGVPGFSFSQAVVKIFWSVFPSVITMGVSSPSFIAVSTLARPSLTF